MIVAIRRRSAAQASKQSPVAARRLRCRAVPTSKRPQIALAALRIRPLLIRRAIAHRNRRRRPSHRGPRRANCFRRRPTKSPMRASLCNRRACLRRSCCAAGWNNAAAMRVKSFSDFQPSRSVTMTRRMFAAALALLAGLGLSTAGLAVAQANRPSTCECVDCRCPDCNGEVCTCDENCECGDCGCAASC